MAQFPEIKSPSRGPIGEAQANNLLRSRQDARDFDYWQKMEAIRKLYRDDEIDAANQRQDDFQDLTMFRSALDDELTRLKSTHNSLMTMERQSRENYLKTVGIAFDETEFEYTDVELDADKKITQFDDDLDSKYNVMFEDILNDISEAQYNLDNIDDQMSQVLGAHESYQQAESASAHVGGELGIDYITGAPDGKGGYQRHNLYTSEDMDATMQQVITDINKMYSDPKQYKNFVAWDLKNLKPWQQAAVNRIKTNEKKYLELNKLIKTGAAADIKLHSEQIDQSMKDKNAPVVDLENEKAHIMSYILKHDFNYAAMTNPIQGLSASTTVKYEDWLASNPEDPSYVEYEKSISMAKLAMASHPLVKAAGGIDRFNLVYGLNKQNPEEYLNAVVKPALMLYSGYREIQEKTGQAVDAYNKKLMSEVKANRKPVTWYDDNSINKQEYIRAHETKFLEEASKKLHLNTKQFSDKLGTDDPDINERMTRVFLTRNDMDEYGKYMLSMTQNITQDDADLAAKNKEYLWQYSPLLRQGDDLTNVNVKLGQSMQGATLFTVNSQFIDIDIIDKYISTYKIDDDITVKHAKKFQTKKNKRKAEEKKKELKKILSQPRMFDTGPK